MSGPEIRLVRFSRDGSDRVGLVDDEDVLDLAAAAVVLGLDAPTLEDVPHRGFGSLMTRWDHALEEVRQIRERVVGSPPEEALVGLEDLELGPPVAPLKLLFAGANYGKHRTEAQEWLGSASANGSTETQPYIFTRLPETVIGPEAPIVKPGRYDQLDYEVELGAVIGTAGKHIAPERALDHVAAFVLVNDVSLRDLQRRSDWPEMATDWLSGKSFDSSCPVGPYLVPRECIPDYRSLRLILSVNGEVRQDEYAAEMTFSLEEQIAFVSSFLTLNPGDLISTGTPSGVAFGRPDTPWLRAGDVVTTEVAELGRQRNEVVAEAATSWLSLR
jgi:2,4-diketo-3-deoxy-L-fuconate hydrolase